LKDAGFDPESLNQNTSIETFSLPVHTMLSAAADREIKIRHIKNFEADDSKWLIPNQTTRKAKTGEFSAHIEANPHVDLFAAISAWLAPSKQTLLSVD
jgi:hypothetical protein